MSSDLNTRGVLRIEDEDRVRLMTFDRGESLNAFNDDLYDAVREGLADAASRSDIAVVMLTGAGRAFSAGQDMGEMAKPRIHDDYEPHGFLPFIETVESFPKPLIAAVNGLGIGIGLTLLLHCDQVLIADDARLRAPFVGLGVTAEAGSSFLLPEAVGWQRAANLLFTATWLDAQSAVETGLALRRCPPESLVDEALDLARSIAAMPISALVATKKVMLDSRIDAVRAARDNENAAWVGLVGGPANREAIAAFLQRRKPDFTNLPEA